MPLTVLCVDDDVHSLLARTVILKHHGYKILSAHNGAEALKQVQANNQIGLIVLDSRMPSMRGAELAKRLRRLRPKVPIMMVSAEQVGGCGLDCVDAYLEKCWPTDYFIAVVGTLTKNMTFQRSR